MKDIFTWIKNFFNQPKHSFGDFNYSEEEIDNSPVLQNIAILNSSAVGKKAFKLYMAHYNDLMTDPKMSEASADHSVEMLFSKLYKLGFSEDDAGRIGQITWDYLGYLQERNNIC